MSLEYELSLNKLTTPPSYAARVRPRATISTPALATAIASTSSMSEADVAGVLLALAQQVQMQLLAGNWVDIDGLGALTTSLKARVPGPTDPLPADASVEIGYRAASALRKAIQTQAELTRIDPSDQAPLLLTLTVKVGGGLDLIMDDNVLELQGDRLGLDETKPDEGVFLVPTSGSALRITNYLRNGDKALLFALPSGITDGTEYTLQVRNRRPGSITLRTTSWPVLLVGQV